MVNGQLDDQKVRQATQLVLGGKPRNYLPILSHFHRLVKLELARRTALIESPTPLSAEMRARVTQRLTTIYGAGLDMGFGENKNLIGGLRIQVGSDVYDGSVQARLTALEDAF